MASREALIDEVQTLRNENKRLTEELAGRYKSWANDRADRAEADAERLRDELKRKQAHLEGIALHLDDLGTLTDTERWVRKKVQTAIDPERGE